MIRATSGEKKMNKPNNIVSMEDAVGNSGKFGTSGGKPGTISSMMQNQNRGTPSYMTVPQIQEMPHIFVHSK